MKEDLDSDKLIEDGITMFGYKLMWQGKLEDALVIFKLSTELYPDAYNTYDSLGECLLEMDRIEEGIEAYEKSLELNPGNKNAEKVLGKFKRKK